MKSNRTHSGIRAVVVQKTCPHYRKPFFEALTRSRTVQFSVAFGSARPWDSLQGTEPGMIRHIPLDNVWLARTGDWVWQAGALRLAWDRTIDVLILDSDPRILSNLLLCLLGRLLRKKILLWGHGIGSRRSWFVRTLKAYLPRLLNGYLFILRMPKSKRVVIYYFDIVPGKLFGLLWWQLF